MAYTINNECISCGACADECPTSSISEGATQYQIDPDTCIDCAACVDVCPTGSISAQSVYTKKYIHRYINIPHIEENCANPN